MRCMQTWVRKSYFCFKILQIFKVALKYCKYSTYKKRFFHLIHITFISKVISSYIYLLSLSIFIKLVGKENETESKYSDFRFVKIPADKLSLFLKQGNLKENTYIS